MTKPLTQREEIILGNIIREYIRTAEPVGSKRINERANLNVSPATIRGDMSSLESEGFLESPHTSAGRMPTERAYQYYVANCLNEYALSSDEIRELNAIWSKVQSSQDQLKLMARVVAEVSREGVFLAFSRHDVYYTGLSNLFSQPEFREDAPRFQMSVVIDHLDEAVGEFFDEVKDGIKVLVGARNPFGSGCGVIVARYKMNKEIVGIFGVLGPIRMDYEANVARIDYVRQGLSKL